MKEIAKVYHTRCRDCNRGATHSVTSWEDGTVVTHRDESHHESPAMILVNHGQFCIRHAREERVKP